MRYTNTPNEDIIARESLDAALEQLRAGKLYIDMVQVKAITRSNAAQLFPPGIADIVRRYLGCPSVPTA